MLLPAMPYSVIGSWILPTWSRYKTFGSQISAGCSLRLLEEVAGWSCAFDSIIKDRVFGSHVGL